MTETATTPLADKARPFSGAFSEAFARTAGVPLWTPAIDFGSTHWQVQDDAGVAWICENLDGWADLPESDLTIAERSFDHGAWLGEGWYGPRQLTLSCALAAPDRYGLQMALHALRAQHVAALAALVPLRVSELDAVRSLLVRAAHARMAVEYLSPTAARVEFELIADWPIKDGAARAGSAGPVTSGTGRTYPRPDAHGFRAYGAAASSGDIVASNNGNAPSRPQFTITGPCAQPQIIAPALGRRLHFDITLAAGDRLAVDSANHAVVLNSVGSRRYALTPDSAWFAIPPGGTTLQFRTDTNTGTLAAQWVDGWW